MADMETIIRAVDKYKEQMYAAERSIWQHPETGYKEWKTHALCADALEAMGYKLVKAGDIPGFYTDIDTGRPGPKVLIMSELDSIINREHPECSAETGAVHACGHHCQTSSMIGLAGALTEPGILDGLSGSIRLMFVPAEELIELEYRESLRKQGVIHYYGGKVEFMYRGFMDGCDMAFYTHTRGGEPGALYIHGGENGCITKTFAFHGKSTHAAGAYDSVNALYAANVAMTAVNALRETFREADYSRVHPIITGRAGSVNVIPDCITMETYIRGASLEAIQKVNAKVNRAIAASAAAMGARAHITDQPGYMPVSPDPLLRQTAIEAANLVAEPGKALAPEAWNTGCTDMGDISSVMPTVCTGASGMTGAAHGADLYVTDQHSALVMPARFHLALLTALLRDDAAIARRIKAEAKPVFPSIAAYFEKLRELTLDIEAVTYHEDGNVTLNLH